MELSVLRRFTNIAFNSFSQRLARALPVDVSFRGILLKFSGQVDVSGGSASGAALSEAPFSLVTNVRVRANGKHVLWDVDGGTLATINRIWGGTAHQSTNAVDGTAANNQAVAFSLYIPFTPGRWMTRNPGDFILSKSWLRTLDLEIAIGGKANLVTGANDRTFAFDTLGCEVYLDVVEDLNEQVNGTHILKVFSIDKSISASNTREKTDIAAGFLFRGILFKGEVETGSAHSTYNPSNAVFDANQIYAGSVELMHMLEEEHRDKNKIDMGLETWPTGYYWHDFSPDGLGTQLLNTRNLKDINVISNVVKDTNGTRFKLVPFEVVPRAEAA